MIVVSDSGRLRIVTQADHAHLAGEIASLWRADGLPESPRRGDVVFAAREHDNGWREADSAPRVDPENGRPFDFTTLPDGPRIELWRRGIERHAERRPYAALLVCRHAEAVNQDRRGEPAWDEGLFERLDELSGELLEATGADPSQVDDDYRFVALADRISLAACARWTEPFELAGSRGQWSGGPGGGTDGETVFLDPFPLAGATTFRIRCRFVTDRRHTDSVDLIGDLAWARWTEIPVRLAPRDQGADERIRNDI